MTRSNEHYIVAVEHLDFDGDTEMDFYGPFRSVETANAYAAKLNEAFQRISAYNDDRHVNAYVRWIRRPLLTEPLRNAQIFLMSGDDDD